MKLKFSIALILITLTINAQVHKFKALEYIGKNQGEEEWSKPEQLIPPVLVVLDLDNSKYKIYNKNTNTLDIVDKYDIITDEDGNTLFNFLCVDKEGEELMVVHRFNKDNRGSQLFLLFKDFSIGYNLIDN